MLQNVKLYYRDQGKLAMSILEHCDNYQQAIWTVRQQVFGETETWFEKKVPVMALVNK